MPKQDQEIVFRRIRGKIVPIRKKKGTSKRKQQALRGAALLGGAAALAGASGLAAGRIFRSAAKVGKQSIEMTKGAKRSFDVAHGGSDIGRKAQEILMRGSARRAKKTATRLAVSKTIFKLGAGAFVGATAIEGFSQLAESAKGSKLTIPESIGTNVVGAGLAVASVQGFKSGAGRNLITKILSKGRL